MIKAIKCPNCGKITEYDIENDYVNKDVLGVKVICPECKEEMPINLSNAPQKF